LGNVDLNLQENKAVNLSIAAPKVSKVVIRPKETFSFWSLVGSCTRRKGYREGLVIRKGELKSSIGGGMCQFTNLIHWLVLHSPLDVTEHHHHDGYDLFPDFDRQVPFGVGTSIMHNYLDYRFKNNTDSTYQLIVYTTEKYLCGELRSDRSLNCKYHICAEDEFFSFENGDYYRNNTIMRKCVDKKTGNVLEKRILMKNHAKVMYDSSFIESAKLRA
jgi:vancomycin resistance protein VanW